MLLKQEKCAIITAVVLIASTTRNVITVIYWENDHGKYYYINSQYEIKPCIIEVNSKPDGHDARKAIHGKKSKFSHR